MALSSSRVFDHRLIVASFSFLPSRLSKPCLPYLHWYGSAKDFHCPANSFLTSRNRLKSTISEGEVSFSNLPLERANAILSKTRFSLPSPFVLYDLRAKS